MTQSLFLEENYAYHHFYANVEQPTSYDIQKEHIARPLDILASSKHCGSFLLIDKLLSIDVSNTKLKMRNCSLADKMINNLYKMTIAITTPDEESVLAFVKDMINEARSIVQNPYDNHIIVHMYAKRFLNALEIFQFNIEKTIAPILAGTWEDFALHFFQRKLFSMMAHS